jgi:hypothetical protein
MTLVHKSAKSKSFINHLCFRLAQMKKTNNSSGIEAFLEDNYKLITIMGVFGALSVYLTEVLDNSDLFYQTGVVASFALFLLISLLILWKCRGKLINMESPNLSLAVLIENVKLLLFLFPLYWLVFIISCYVIFVLSSFEIFLGFFMFMLGAILTLGTLIIVNNKVENAVLYILIGPTLFIVISYFGFYFVRIHDFIPQLFFASTGIVSAAILITKITDLILARAK